MVRKLCILINMIQFGSPPKAGRNKSKQILITNFLLLYCLLKIEICIPIMRTLLYFIPNSLFCHIL